MKSSQKIIIALLAIVALLSAANLGITTLGISSSIEQSAPVQTTTANQTNPKHETDSPINEKRLFVEIPAESDIVMKDYFLDYTPDKALQDIKSQLGDLRNANGAYNISIMKGDGIGSVVLRESSCGGDACGMQQLAYRNGIQQLSANYVSGASSITLVTDGKEYVVQPVYDASCSFSGNAENKVNLLGVTITEGDTVSSYSLTEKLSTPCFLNAPNGGYDNPYIDVTGLYSDWGYFGANLEVADVRVQIHFSDEVATQSGSWR